MEQKPSDKAKEVIRPVISATSPKSTTQPTTSFNSPDSNSKLIAHYDQDGHLLVEHDSLEHFQWDQFHSPNAAFPIGDFATTTISGIESLDITSPAIPLTISEQEAPEHPIQGFSPSKKARSKGSKSRKETIQPVSEVTAPESEVAFPLSSVDHDASKVPHDIPLMPPTNTELLFVTTQTTSVAQVKPVIEHKISRKSTENAIQNPTISVEDATDTEQSYKRHVLSRIQMYEKQSLQSKKVHDVMQLIILIGAATVSIIIGIPEVPKLIPAIISGIVTVTTIVVNYFKLGERSRDLYLTAEDLSQEYNWFDTGRNSYKNKSAKEALDLFMNRTEALIRKQTKRSFALESAGEEQRNDTKTN